MVWRAPLGARVGHPGPLLPRMALTETFKQYVVCSDAS